MAELNNVIAVTLPIHIQRMASYSWYFDFYEEEDGDPIDPATFMDVRMDVRNRAGKVELSYRIGKGFNIVPEAGTGRNMLVMDKDYTEDNLPAADNYNYDMLVIRNDKDACIPLEGPLSYTKNTSK